MKNKSSFLGLTLALTLTLAGCGATDAAQEEVPSLSPSAAENSSPEPSNPETQPPVAGDDCGRLGEKEESDNGELECRYLAGMNLAWQPIGKQSEVPTLEVNTVGYEACQIRDARTMRGGGATSFPMTSERMRVDGQLDLAIIPIDYPDSNANQSLDSFLGPQVDAFNEMFAMWAGDNESVKWNIPEDWIRMPKESQNYQWDHQTVQGDGSRKADSDIQLLSVEEQQYDIFSEAEKFMDLSDVDYAYIISNPDSPKVLFAPYWPGGTIRTSIGRYDFPHYGFGTVITKDQGRQLYHFLWHEMLHFRGLAGHAPGNEFSYNLMTAGETLFAWDAFLLGWQEPEQLLCFDAQVLESETFYLGSMEVAAKGPRGAVVRLSDTEVLVIESRRKGRFNYSIPDGFAGVQVYIVDSTKPAERYDGNIEREKDYFSYHLRIDRKDHRPIPEMPQVWVPGYPDLNETAFPGDSFTYENIRISYLEGGDFDKVQIEHLG